MKDEISPCIRIVGHYPEDESDITKRIKMVVSNELGKDIESIDSFKTRDRRNVLELGLPKKYTLNDQEISLGIDQAGSLLSLVEHVILGSFGPSNIEISIEFP